MVSQESCGKFLATSNSIQCSLWRTQIEVIFNVSHIITRPFLQTPHDRSLPGTHRIVGAMVD